MTIFSQIDSIPATTFKWVIATLIVILGVCAALVSIYAALRRRSINIEPQPVEVRKQSKRYRRPPRERSSPQSGHADIKSCLHVSPLHFIHDTRQ
jgi:hypothetical protein